MKEYLWKTISEMIDRILDFLECFYKKIPNAKKDRCDTVGVETKDEMRRVAELYERIENEEIDLDELSLSDLRAIDRYLDGIIEENEKKISELRASIDNANGLNEQ